MDDQALAYLVPSFPATYQASRCQLVYANETDNNNVSSSAVFKLTSQSQIEAYKTLEANFNETLEISLSRFAFFFFFLFTDHQPAASQAAAHSIMSRFHDDCLIEAGRCLLPSAIACLRNEQILWQAFVAYYLPIAVILVTLGIIFNSICLTFIAKSRLIAKTSRAFIANLAISDTLLSIMTLLKRMADFFLEHEIKMAILYFGNMLWQTCWLVSIIGLALLVFDLLFLSAKRSRAVLLCVKILIPLLWLGAGAFVGLLGAFELAYSELVQIAICSLTLFVFASVALVLVGNSIAAFYRRRKGAPVQLINASTSGSDDDIVIEGEEGQPPAVILGEVNKQKKHSLQPLVTRQRKRLVTTKRPPVRSNSLAIGLIIATSCVSWLPLVAYFLTDDLIHTENIVLSQQLLAVSLICFHLNGVTKPIIYWLRFGATSRG